MWTCLFQHCSDLDLTVPALSVPTLSRLGPVSTNIIQTWACLLQLRLDFDLSVPVLCVPTSPRLGPGCTNIVQTWTCLCQHCLVVDLSVPALSGLGSIPAFVWTWTSLSQHCLYKCGAGMDLHSSICPDLELSVPTLSRLGPACPSVI